MKSKVKKVPAPKRDPWGQPLRIRDTTIKVINELHPKKAPMNQKLYNLLKELKELRRADSVYEKSTS